LELGDLQSFTRTSNNIYRVSIKDDAITFLFPTSSLEQASRLAIDGLSAAGYDFHRKFVETGSRMSVSIVRIALCWVLIVGVPVTLLGQTPSAILHAQGGVWVNGFEAPDSSTIFSGDSLETKPGFSATLTLTGTSVLFAPETVGKFQGDVFVLDHGSVAVETSKRFKVRVNCITVVPVLDEFTKYEVNDVNGTVEVAARKLDVNVQTESQQKKIEAQDQQTDTSGGGVVHETEEKSYHESSVCGAPAAPLNPGTAINPKWIAAGAGGAGLLILLLLHGGGGKSSISPSTP
jgi:hypothetical protein